MNEKDLISKIKQDKNHTVSDIEVAVLLNNFELEFVCSGKQIKNQSGKIIGEIDLAFFDNDEGILFLVEVAKQNNKTSQKVDHFFSKWSNEDNLKIFTEKYQLTPKKIIKINFDLFERKKDDKNSKASLNHALDESNVLIGLKDFRYFENSFKIVDKWAKNDFYNYLSLNSDSGFDLKDAIAFKVGNEIAYVFADKVSNILRYSYISRKRDNELGYQRMVEQGRIGSILKSIKRKKTITFPNSIILNSNSKLVDKDKVQDLSVVQIKIPKGYCSFKVLDGQHRLMGFAKMGSFKRNDYSLPIVLLENIGKSKEVQTFIEINHKQKRLDSNLILSLKADFDWDKTDKEFFEKISVLIAKDLNKNSELKNNIYFGYADEKKGNKVTVTTLHSAIHKNNLTGLKNHLYQTDNTKHEEAYTKIKEVLSTISKVLKSEKHFFFTNKGVRIMFRFIQLFEKNRVKGLIGKTFEEILVDIKDSFPSKSIEDELSEYYGEGGANKAVEYIIEKLKENSDYSNFEVDLRRLK